ncbi:hypothetical protein EHS13_28455 [Paenibacillus psychroresistens]|uniref:Uncharacterized protein n=1 Tax=Paenibacillus psychroresistens TaxID=1778678 RepID=A0A6B8RQ75_9BACL|nr:hypothetical protein [Paenibacillus psychroresistens]QGQ98531.1 hypothetical protein EHS13_28455 [Paenibacillus psychroresistens]
MIKYEIVGSRLSEERIDIENEGQYMEEKTIKEIEGIIEQFGLLITQKSPLSTLKGSTHYHLKIGKQAGLLEVTYWPVKKRLWVEIHDNRRAEWNQAMISSFSEALAVCFSGSLEHIVN